VAVGKCLFFQRFFKGLSQPPGGPAVAMGFSLERLPGIDPENGFTSSQRVTWVTGRMTARPAWSLQATHRCRFTVHPGVHNACPGSSVEASGKRPGSSDPFPAGGGAGRRHGYPPRHQRWCMAAQAVRDEE